MIPLDLAGKIRPPVPEPAPPAGAGCHRLAMVDLQIEIRRLEDQHTADLHRIAELEARLKRITRDWCQLLVEFSAWAGRIAAPPADGPEA